MRTLMLIVVGVSALTATGCARLSRGLGCVVLASKTPEIVRVIFGPSAEEVRAIARADALQEQAEATRKAAEGRVTGLETRLDAMAQQRLAEMLALTTKAGANKSQMQIAYLPSMKAYDELVADLRDRIKQLEAKTKKEEATPPLRAKVRLRVTVNGDTHEETMTIPQ